ncbi:MAG: PQQ-binding-like beta-propeller repeat protein [Verrucomicrobiota bacterium]
MISACRCACACLALLILSSDKVAAADWPQWRGPERNGHVPVSEKIPAQLPPEPKTIWRLNCGESLASPVVARGKVFHLDGRAGKETLIALDANDGREVWQAVIDDVFRDMQGPAGPRATPMVEGDRVYALSCKGELQCRSTADGQLIWRANYTQDFEAVFIGEKGGALGATRHGNNGTPIIDGPHLIGCVGGTNGAGVVCFDKLNGRVVWKSTSEAAAYAPPIVATLAGRKQGICFMAEALLGLDRGSGELLWRVPMKTAFGRHVTTPVVHGDVVIVASHQVGLVGTRIVREGDGFKAEQAWLSKESAINFASPVLVGDFLYGLGPEKNLFCVEAATGKLRWTKAGYFVSSSDKAHASFLVLGKNLLVLTDAGQLVLIEANPNEFREISRAQICGFNWCNPAYADGRLYVRDGIKTTGDLICVDLLGD